MGDAPVSKEPWPPHNYPLQPLRRPHGASPKPFVFPFGPSYESIVQLPEYRVELRLVELTVVIDPTTNGWIEAIGQLTYRELGPSVRPPAPDPVPYCLGSLWADRWQEVQEPRAITTALSTAWLEPISQEVKADHREIGLPIPVFAVDDLRLLGVQGEPALR